MTDKCRSEGEGPMHPLVHACGECVLVQWSDHRLNSHRLPPPKVGMIIDRGHDFPEHIQQALDAYGADIWLYRDDTSRSTTRAVNIYRGEHRGYA